MSSRLRSDCRTSLLSETPVDQLIAAVGCCDLRATLCVTGSWVQFGSLLVYSWLLLELTLLFLSSPSHNFFALVTVTLVAF